MTPSTIILGVLTVGLWFGAMPFLIAAYGKDEGISLLMGFVLMWGSPVAVGAFVAGLMALDRWWLNRRRDR